MFVAAADVNGDGRADVVTSPGAGGGARVRVFDGTALMPALPPEPVADFLAGADGDRGGVRVAAKPPVGDQPGVVVVGSGDRGRVTAYRLPSTPSQAPEVAFDLDVFASDLSGVLVG